MKQTLAPLAALLLAPLATSHAAGPTSETARLDIAYKNTAQGPLRLDLHYPASVRSDANCRLIAGVSWYGPCDFETTELFNPDGRAGFRDRFGGRIVQGDADPQTKLAACREVSPVNYLKPGSPPLLLIQGDQDTTIPAHHARHMKERADAVKAPVKILIVRNAGHNWRAAGGELGPSLEGIVSTTAAFLKQQLDAAAAGTGIR